MSKIEGECFIMSYWSYSKVKELYNKIQLLCNDLVGIKFCLDDYDYSNDYEEDIKRIVNKHDFNYSNKHIYFKYDTWKDNNNLLATLECVEIHEEVYDSDGFYGEGFYDKPYVKIDRVEVRSNINNEIRAAVGRSSLSFPVKGDYYEL